MNLWSNKFNFGWLPKKVYERFSISILFMIAVSSDI